MDVAWEAGASAWDVCRQSCRCQSKKSWAGRAPSLEGRTYLGIWATANEEQRRVVEETWRLVDEELDSLDYLAAEACCCSLQVVQ